MEESSPRVDPDIEKVRQRVVADIEHKNSPY